MDHNTIRFNELLHWRHIFLNVLKCKSLLCDDCQSVFSERIKDIDREIEEISRNNVVLK